MGTKLNPGAFDCYTRALPDEPMFVLLARDPYAPDLVGEWADMREVSIEAGDRPASDAEMVKEADRCAQEMREWRKANEGRWRLPEPAVVVGVKAVQEPKPRPNLAPGPWEHHRFRHVYNLLAVALGTDGEWHVVYQNPQSLTVFVRPAGEWEEQVPTTNGACPRFSPARPRPEWDR